MVEECSLFVKLSPESKARIIQILKENGHTVAYMGDGINDTPAMKKADVAISVDTAVDIAKRVRTLSCCTRVYVLWNMV